MIWTTGLFTDFYLFKVEKIKFYGGLLPGIKVGVFIKMKKDQS